MLRRTKQLAKTFGFILCLLIGIKYMTVLCGFSAHLYVRLQQQYSDAFFPSSKNRPCSLGNTLKSLLKKLQQAHLYY